MNNSQVQQLLDAHLKGKLSRRDFVVQAGALLAGTAMAATSFAHANEPAAAATPPPTPSATPEPDMRLVTQMVEFKANGQTAPGYLARPEGDGPFPGVVVIQEWWGLDDHIKSVTERMARNGFAAVAPDLYRGQVADEPNEARKLAMDLILDQAIMDVQGAADYLTAQPFVSPKKVGVMGFCMGGRLSMMMSWRGETNIGAVVVFYGGGVNPTDADFKAVKVPVLGLYGEADGGIPVSNIRRWEARFKEFGKVNEMVIYPDAPHAFFNDTRPSYRPEAAADALRRTLAWFAEYLK